MNRLVGLAFLMFTASALPAQSMQARDTAVSGGVRVSFEMRRPTVDPQWFEIVAKPDGSARYRSLPREDSKSSDPAPYELSFTLSPQSRQSIFAVAPGLMRLRGTLDKNKVAFTGTKTVRYEDGTGVSSAISYNYSSAPELMAFTELMEGISETIEYSQTLQFETRFDKLALDATLRTMENLVSIDRLAELQLLKPELNRIANDSTILHIARERARHILQIASEGRPKGK